MLPPLLHRESVCLTSNRIGFDSFRLVVREATDEAEVGTGRRGFPFLVSGIFLLRKKDSLHLATSRV